MENGCFICADDCSQSNLFLINLETKKHKTKYPFLIGNLIKSEYELRISKSDKICFKCHTVLEKYDELNSETKMLQNVLSRQIANTYNIDTDAEILYLDKTKIFTELRSNGNNSDGNPNFSCKQCPRFVTNNIDTVNSHIIFHQIMSEQAKPKTNSTSSISSNNNSSQKTTSATQSKNTREVHKELNTVNLKTNKSLNSSVNEIAQVPKTPLKSQTNSAPASANNGGRQEYTEAELDSLIDLNLLEDEFYDSNLKQNTCLIGGNCQETFTYASEYVRHLKLKHKLSPNQIFTAVRENLKRPAKMNKLTCPYCFTKVTSPESLEEHVKQHETISKGGLFATRLNDFFSSIMKTCRCKVCDCEMLDPTALACNHEIVKNGMAPKMNCMFCEDHFYSQKLYNNHLALQHGYCFVCSSTCSDRAVLKDHICSHISHSEFACPFCKDIYQNNSSRQVHIRAKHMSQCCPHCNEWYMNLVDLQNHIRFAHADKRYQEQKASICDTCGQSFKHKQLHERHMVTDHKQRRIYKCTTCVLDFKFRYLLMEHLASVHNRTVVDNEVNFYKCCFCQKGFSSQNRKLFISHIESHQISNSFCYDCNTNTESLQQLEIHRERSHQDFSKSLDFSDASKSLKQDVQTRTTTVVQKARKQSNADFAPVSSQPQQHQLIASQSPKPLQFEVVNNSALSTHPEQTQQTQPSQQIVLQSEDGSLLNMNNLILTESGELIIQNLDGLMPSSQEGDEGAQIQISNLEQFLMEQGLAGNTEISYIQSDMIGEDNGQQQVIIQNNQQQQQQQDSLLQTYKEIFETNDEITHEMIGDTDQQSQNILLNGEYLVQAPPKPQASQKAAATTAIVQHSIEHVDVGNTQQALDAANQSTLDELGDILLEVAAAADKEKKPKTTEQKALRETLWGKKRNLEIVKEPASKRRSGKLVEPVPENDTPARDFSQAYEFFVRGFDLKKQKQL